MTTRRADIDVIRGFAMVMIVLTHVAMNTYAPSVSGPLGLVIGSAALFFMTSGAMNLPVRVSPAAFYRRRILRLGVLFVLWSVAYAILGHTLGDSPRPLSEELKWLIVTPTWGPGWFVYTLIGLYLAMPIVTPWLRHASVRQLRWLVGAWLVTGFLPLVGLHTYVNWFETALTPFTGFLGYAIAGYWLDRDCPRRRTLLLIGAAGLAFGVKFYATGLKYGWEGTMTNDLSINIMAINIATFGLIATWRSMPRIIVRIFTPVSRYSLGIFLSHWLIIEYVTTPLGMSFAPALATTLAASMAIAIAQDKLTTRHHV